MPKRATNLTLALILLLAGALRLRSLEASALWWDEGNNAYFAKNPLAIVEMSRATHDTDPPAHRLALAAWLGLLGDSAYNLRLLSVVCGVLTILLVFCWGNWLGGPYAGLVAALLTALSPMAIYYSREAKAYPFVTLFTCLALYVWARYLDTSERPRRVFWLVYILSSAVALGAHYYAVFLVPAQAIWLIVSSISSRLPRPEATKRLSRWLLAQLAIGALILPWILLTHDTAVSGAAGLSATPLGAAAYLRSVLSCFAAGPHAPSWAAGLVIVLLALAILPELLCGQPSPAGFAATATLVPVFLGFAAQRAFPFFAPRFFLYVIPCVHLLTALGLARLRWKGIAIAVPLLAAWLIILPSAYAPFAPTEEDLRPVARTLRDLAQPDDVIIVGYIWHEGILRMYAPDVDSQYHLGWFGANSAGKQLLELFSAHPRLWLVKYEAPVRHPSSPGGWWLENHATRVALVRHGLNRLALYLPPCITDQAAVSVVTLENRIRMRYSPMDEERHANEPLVVALQWEIGSPVIEPYSVFVHLADERGKPWAQSDGGPQNGLIPFTEFDVGQTVTDCRGMLITPDVPPGHYTLIAGLYHPATGRRLTLIGGQEPAADHCVIGEIIVRPS